MNPDDAPLYELQCQDCSRSTRVSSAETADYYAWSHWLAEGHEIERKPIYKPSTSDLEYRELATDGGKVQTPRPSHRPPELTTEEAGDDPYIAAADSPRTIGLVNDAGDTRFKEKGEHAATVQLRALIKSLNLLHEVVGNAAVDIYSVPASDEDDPANALYLYPYLAVEDVDRGLLLAGRADTPDTDWREEFTRDSDDELATDGGAREQEAR